MGKELHYVVSNIDSKKFAGRRVKPEYLSLSVPTILIYIIIIASIFLSITTISNTIIFINGAATFSFINSSSIQVFLFTLESAIIHGFIISSFVSIEYFFV